ncbi:MAG TPA: hypothetical protein VI248_11590 [Kineosporiaceae bacterium]
MADVPGDRTAMTEQAPGVTARRWRTRRSAAIAGILFAVLLTSVLVVVRSAAAGTARTELAGDAGRRAAIRVGLAAVPFAGIAFLWFIGVIRDQVGAVEDRLFSTVFLGSGLLFIAMLFMGAVVSSSMLEALDREGTAVGGATDVWDLGRGATRVLVSVYAMRMAAVFTLSVSTLALRTRSIPRWVAVLGYVEALALLVVSTDNPWVQLAFPAWVLVVSLTILLTRPAQPAPAPRAPPASPSSTPGAPGGP